MLLEQLDLDINNYEITDIERFFRLKPNTKYSADEIQYKEVVIRNQLLNSGNINKKFKADLIHFLEKAKKWLIDVKCPPPPVPTSIPPNFRLDPTPTIPNPYISINRSDEIINIQPSVALHTTNGNQYYTGLLNPIESRLKTINICIDTIFRKNYNDNKSTDFTYILPKSINNVVSMSLTSFEFPCVWQIISSTRGNNKMTIYLYNMSEYPDSSYDIVIPDGNYNQSTFTTTLNNIFNIIGCGLDFLWCEIDDITLGTVIRSRNPKTDDGCGPYPFCEEMSHYSPNFCFKIDFNVSVDGCLNTENKRPIYKNLGWLLGFRETSYLVTPSNQTISLFDDEFDSVHHIGYLKSESFFGSLLNNYMFVEIDDFQNNFPTDSIISTNDSFGNYLGKNIIARVIIRSGVNTILNDNSADMIFKKRDYFGPIKLDKLKLRVLDRFGDVIDIGKNDYSMTLELTILNTK